MVVLYDIFSIKNIYVEKDYVFNQDVYIRCIKHLCCIRDTLLCYLDPKYEKLHFNLNASIKFCW